MQPGLNTIYIRDINDCGITTSNEISFLFFQRHFSPNNDNIFDTWTIKEVDNTYYTLAELKIFDRYGNFLKRIDLKTDKGWDGRFDGKLLTSNDYWYNANLIDLTGAIRKKIGHFSLLRK